MVMHESPYMPDFNRDSANVTARPRYVDWRHFRREKTVESAIDVTIPTGMLHVSKSQLLFLLGRNFQLHIGGLGEGRGDPAAAPIRVGVSPKGHNC